MERLSKRDTIEYIKSNKHNFMSLLNLIEYDLKELVEHLCLQRNHDDKTHLQGQIFKLLEYRKLIAPN